MEPSEAISFMETTFEVNETNFKGEGGGIGFNVIIAAYPWKYLISGSEWSVFRRYVASNLGHYLEHGYLFQVCRFTTLQLKNIAHWYLFLKVFKGQFNLFYQALAYHVRSCYD